jgi:hypothetical protein
MLIEEIAIFMLHWQRKLFSTAKMHFQCTYLHACIMSLYAILYLPKFICCVLLIFIKEAFLLLRVQFSSNTKISVF